MINTLSLRVNYLICQRFLEKIQVVMENAERRIYDEAYDLMIATANRRWERQEQDVFSEDDL